MAYTPQQLGSLNRLLSSIIIPANPGLNITPSYLSKEAVSWEPQGQATTRLPGLTGGVNSPEPYLMTRVTIHLLKSIALSDAYLQQFEQNTLIGEVTFYFDSPVMNPRQLTNAALMGVNGISGSGTDAGMVVTLEGDWNVNQQLWP